MADFYSEIKYRGEIGMLLWKDSDEENCRLQNA
jgi:hypothetical protein